MDDDIGTTSVSLGKSQTIFDLLGPMLNTVQTNVKCHSAHMHIPGVCTHIRTQSIPSMATRGAADQSRIRCKRQLFAELSPGRKVGKHKKVCLCL